MAEKPDQPGDFTDPDKTDRLPVLEGSTADADVADDAVPLEPDWQSRPNARRDMLGGSAAAAQPPARQHAAELRALGDALITRDATILQMLQTLDERNTELDSLRCECAQIRRSFTAASRRGETALDAGQQELITLRAQTAAYLELLQTGAWRREYQMSLFLARDDDVPRPPPSAAPRLPDEPARAAATADEQGQAREQLQAAAADRALIADLQAQVEALQAQAADLLTMTKNLNAALVERDMQIAAQAKAIAEHEAGAATTEEQMTVLLAHLHEARRPAQELDAERRRLAEELALSTARATSLAAENRELKAAVEAARAPHSAPVAPATGATDDGAELTRLDGATPVTYRIGPRTRIGRSTDCELHIDMPSVSRHHALVLTGPNGCIIEDLRSTNGLFVNGRMVLRKQLVDRDIVTIGEAQFEFSSRVSAKAPD